MTKFMAEWVQRFCQHWLAGQSQQSDSRRHEFILNTMLAGIVLATVLAGVCSFVSLHVSNELLQGDTLLNIGLLLTVMLSIWGISRLGQPVLAAYLFLGSIALATLNLALTWSYELPTVELGYAVLVIIAGLTLGAKAALRVSFGLAALTLVLAHAQLVGWLHPHIDWLNRGLQMSDAIDYALALSFIGLVSWLANTEIERASLAAQQHRLALAKERDNLEVKVAERTYELEQLQQARLHELQRLADFGRLHAHILHEVANPLTAASLNLQQTDEQPSAAIQEALKSLRQLERYIDAARQQLSSHSPRRTFNVAHELEQVLTVVRPLANQAGVKLNVHCPARLKLFGDPVKFNQVLTNLVVNAIEAYSEQPGSNKRVTVGVRKQVNALELSVHDWGKGVAASQLSKIFQPFYTTKQAGKRGLGLGLAMVKGAVEADFGGSISVSSSPQDGTRFVISLPITAASKAKHHK